MFAMPRASLQNYSPGDVDSCFKILNTAGPSDSELKLSRYRASGSRKNRQNSDDSDDDIGGKLDQMDDFGPYIIISNVFLPL